MNSSAAPRVQVVCRLVRTWSSHASEAPENRSATGVAARHVAKCAECQRYFAATDQLDRQLRRASLRHVPPVPADLEARIVRAIGPGVSTSRRRAARPGFVWLAVAASGVAAIVAVIQLRESNARTAIVISEQLSAKNPRASGDPRVPIEPLPAAVWSSLVPTVATLKEENPLQRELVAVQSDTRSALRFLARNFLPHDVEATLEPGQNSGSSS